MIQKPIVKPVNVDDPELKALASTVSASNTIPYFTGSGTASSLSVTDAGKALLNTTGATDMVPYFTGTGTVSTASFTTTGRQIVSATSIPNAQSILNLVPGTNVQSQSSKLDAIAGVSSAANKIPYFTGASSADVLTLDTDGTLSANSNTSVPSQAAVKTAISNVFGAVNTYTRQQYTSPVILSSSAGSLTIDCNLHQFCQYTFTEAVTMNAATNQAAGKFITIVFIGAASWSFTSWHSTWKMNTDKTSLIAPTAGKRLTCSFYSDGTNMWLIGAAYEN